MRLRTVVLPVLAGMLIVGAGWPGARARASVDRTQQDAVLAALDAELERSVSGFAAHSERAPYYLGYAVWDRSDVILTAGAGSVLVDRGIRQRLLDVDVRVGDYRLDNTRRLQGRGAPPPPAGGASSIPVSDDVDALRASIWQRTERDYRSALERLVQVEANRAAMAAATDTSGDFSREEPHVLIEEPPAALTLDRDGWKDRLRRVSARFDGAAQIHNAVVTLRATRDVRYVVTSEGTRVRTGDGRVRLTMTGCFARSCSHASPRARTIAAPDTAATRAPARCDPSSAT